MTKEKALKALGIAELTIGSYLSRAEYEGDEKDFTFEQFAASYLASRDDVTVAEVREVISRPLAEIFEIEESAKDAS